MTPTDGPLPAQPPGLIIAAPASGSGKTLVTLGLLRHFRNAGIDVGSAKIGPDYIDPAFHAAAGSGACGTVDLWAMRDRVIASVLRDSAGGKDLFIAEGVMGLFDGAVRDAGSTADAAEHLELPIVLVVDAGRQGASAAAVVRGFATHRPGLPIAAVIFNRVGSDRHKDILIDAMTAALPEVPVLGCLPRVNDLNLPDRHLGLVQAGEHKDLEAFLEGAAAIVAEHLDVNALQALARPATIQQGLASTPLPPLGQRIAVARDEAFSFTYPHVLEGWRRAGADISWFSPLADQLPADDADAVYLPGGYPELHAGRIAGNSAFLEGLRQSAAAGKTMFGECGGYMVLGESLTDADGQSHAMAGLLPLQTSFAERRLHLGYRRAVTKTDSALGPAGSVLRGHEFHYATITNEGPGDPLLTLQNAEGVGLGAAGLRQGSVFGSFLHLIDREDSDG